MHFYKKLAWPYLASALTVTKRREPFCNLSNFSVSKFFLFKNSNWLDIFMIYNAVILNKYLNANGFTLGVGILWKRSILQLQLSFQDTVIVFTLFRCQSDNKVIEQKSQNLKKSRSLKFL